MMRLRIVKYAKNEEEYKDDRDNLPHGTKVMKGLVMTWANMDRIVCTYPYLVSVPAAEELWNHGLCFVGVIKTATRKVLMAYLSNI